MRAAAVTLLFSAFLLFVFQPLAGKMLLPSLGGAAGVWTTCVLFFQIMLLAGYVYAHLLARIRDLRKEAIAHAFILIAPLPFLPVAFDVTGPTSPNNPVLWLLGSLIASAAVPFFAVSTTAPLLQSWYSRTTHTESSDPYFLYAASNAGSLIALLAYPFFIEPRIGVVVQNRFWFFGYVILIAMIGITITTAFRRQRTTTEQIPVTPASWSDRVYWTAAAFVPSGLMLAVTSHIAANVASVPFLWLAPLTIYLATFIVAFGRRVHVSSTRVSRLIPIVLLAFFPLAAAGVVAPPGLNWILIGVHLLLLYSAALLCHTRLAESRPQPEQLTEFYFWLALGGVLGGVFTAIVAPAAFKSILEYPLLLAAVPFFRGGQMNRADWKMPIAVAIVVPVTWIVYQRTGLESNSEAVALAHTAFLFAGYRLIRRPQQFAWTFGVLMIVYALFLPGFIEDAKPIHASRNFFGVKKVLEDTEAGLRKLLHGDTVHGIESVDPTRAGDALSYYYRGGSVSDVVDLLKQRETEQHFAVVGLGSGSMASYADARRHMTFYEIDPAVEPIARTYFSFLKRCGENCDVVTGDGRLQLSRAPDASFDLLLLDAFSSDSVPAHLLSREAMRLYTSKLKADGVLLFHVSNRYLDVERLVIALLKDAGLIAFSRFDEAGDLRSMGKTSAHHVVGARSREILAPLTSGQRWRPAQESDNFEPWTDDYSNLLGLMRWH